MTTPTGDSSEPIAEHQRSERLVRAYYEAIDGGEYDRLAELLDPSFRHERPDRALMGRDRFVRFMRTERPQADTDHVVEGVYTNQSDIAVQGRLLSADETVLFAFIDVFTVSNGSIDRLKTYVDEQQ